MKTYLNYIIRQIKNGKKAGLKKITLQGPCSKSCYRILEILYNEGFIKNFSFKTDQKNKPVIEIYFKYTRHGKNVINSISQISTPGAPVYVSIRSL